MVKHLFVYCLFPRILKSFQFPVDLLCRRIVYTVGIILCGSFLLRIHKDKTSLSFCQPFPMRSGFSNQDFQHNFVRKSKKRVSNIKTQNTPHDEFRGAKFKHFLKINNQHLQNLKFNLWLDKGDISTWLK